MLTGCISDELRQKLSEDSQPGLPDCESQPSRASNDQSTPADARSNLEVRIVGIARDAALEEMPPGEQIWLDARVANNGFGDSAAMTLRYYRLNDDTISARDAQIGVDQVAPLESGRSVELSFCVTAPNSPGTYYYGAGVDAVSGDTDPSNDCSGSVETIVISQETARETNPDLVLRNLRRVGSGAQQAVHVGQALTFQADVENIGDASSRSSTIRFYRSTDSNITTGDAQVGTGGTGIIWPGRNSPQTISLTAHSIPGTYFYGACVDPVAGEKNTTNNCSLAVRVSIGSQPEPDLIVVNVDRGGRGGATYTGQSLSLQAQVRNIGDAQASSTTLRYYLSGDESISPWDAYVGMVRVGVLHSGRATTESITVTAPSSPGTYYYGACVDAVSGESDTNNNCSSYVRVEVVKATAPDLVVTQFRTDERRIGLGDSVPVTLTVKNQGNGGSDATHVTFYISQDSQVATNSSNRSGYGRNIRAFDPSPDQEELRYSITAPDQIGTYYLRVCVFPLAEESNTQNNCSVSVRVQVTLRSTVDLNISSFKVRDTNPYVGDRIVLFARVSNEGNSGSSNSYVYFYQSTSRNYSSPANRLEGFRVYVIEGGLHRDFDHQPTVPSSPGTYYYGACVDRIGNELNYNNNCSGAIRVVVRERDRPDLLVRSFSVNEARVDPGDKYTMSAIVRNQGNAEAEETHLTLYISQTSQVATTPSNASDRYKVPAMGASPDERVLSLEAYASSQIGTYYVRVCVSFPALETNTQNNCSTTYSIEVQRAFRPDLSASIGPIGESGIIYSGGRYKVNGGVLNTGTATSERTVLRYYRSDDRAISNDDVLLSSLKVGPIEPGGSGNKEITAVAPQESDVSYYFYVCLDGGMPAPPDDALRSWREK